MADTSSPVDCTPSAVRRKLCAMMFLQYFVQGAYLTIVADYLVSALGFGEEQKGAFIAAISVGPILAPLLVGQLVDRWFATDRVLAAFHFVAGLLMLALYKQTEYGPVVALGTLYSVLYVPTTMLTNSLAFYHLRDANREFPLVRVWGTIGFIVPAWLIEFYFLQGLTGEALDKARAIVFAVSGVGGLVMSLYCFLLPHTPPQRATSGKFAPGVVFALLKRREFAVLFGVSFFIAMAHQYYFNFNATLVKQVLARGDHADWTARFMTISQITEIGAMALLGPAVARLGFKRVMLIGAACYALRCVLLSGAATWGLSTGAAYVVAGVGQALHGFCFGFFLAAAFMYLDQASPPDIKGSMQTVYGVLVVGLGMVAGGIWGGRMGARFTTGTGASTVYEWSPIWLWCGALAALCVVVLAVAFPKTQTRQT
ncbi:MAG: MFS transporter [Pirellulales bacterium]